MQVIRMKSIIVALNIFALGEYGTIMPAAQIRKEEEVFRIQ